jgi:magnesium transporter
MIAYYAKRSGGETFDRFTRPVSSGMWVDGNNLSVDELNDVVKRYELERNIVYDVRDHQELSRVEFSGGDAYVFLRAPWLAKSGHVASAPLLAIVKKTQFLTLGIHDTVAPESVAHAALSGSTRYTSGDLLLGVIATCVSQYQELLKHTERSINDTGSRLKTHEVTNQDFIHFVVVEDNLTAHRMNLNGILTVVHRLKESKAEKLHIDQEALDDISLQIQQLLVAVESYGGRVESIRNAYSTIANNTLNRRMKTLTVLTVLIALPNVFYGMYGMNIILPFQHEPWAYFAVVGFSVLLILFVYLIAKRSKMF